MKIVYNIIMNDNIKDLELLKSLQQKELLEKIMNEDDLDALKEFAEESFELYDEAYRRLS